MANSNAVAVGKNIQASVDGEDLVLRIHMNTLLGESASGKMNTIASTEGFTTVPFEIDGKSLKMNLYLGTKK